MPYILPLQQFLNRVSTHPDQLFLAQPVDGQWIEYTWSAVDDRARRIAQGLKAHGYQPGDRIAILAKNSAEWVILDIAIMMAGMVSVPIYDSASAETIRYVLEHSESRALFIGKLSDYRPTREAITHQATIGFPYDGVNAQEYWTDWLDDYLPLEAIIHPDPEDMATLVYTSGSEGLPKGVVLSYKNLAAAGTAIAKALPRELKHGLQRQLSYLPMAHITERATVTMGSLYFQLAIYFSESLETFLSDINYAKPTIFLSVPRLWVKFKGNILGQISQRKLDFLLKIPLLGSYVAAKIRSRLGLSETRLFLCGSAPIAPETLRWYRKIGINISEGWGMTETTGGACVNMPFRPDFLGSVGVPLASAEMKLSGSGEILIRGDGIFETYYRDPGKTAASFEGGWFRTGDCGEVTPQGAWRITGRIKEQFKTSKGKFVAPVPIERLLAINSSIEQVCVVGEGRKQPVALIVLQDTVTRDEPTVNTLLKTLEQVNNQLEHHARLDGLLVCKEPWTIENGLLTPTLKIRRNKLEKKYAQWIAGNLNEKITWE